MKRTLCLLFAILICFGSTCTAFASENVFVPSIGYKDGPEVEDAEMNEEKVTDCLVVSSITDAREKTTDITQEDRDLLLTVYEALDNGTMKLPIEENYVIRELVDVNFKVTDCVEASHGHEQWLAEENTTVSITFDLGVARNTELIVLSYHDGAWENLVSVTNNGDGTVTCVFEHFCPVAFCVVEEDDAPAQTGDVMGQNLMLWTVLMAASALCMVILLLRRKTAQEGRGA